MKKVPALSLLLKEEHNPQAKKRMAARWNAIARMDWWHPSRWGRMLAKLAVSDNISNAQRFTLYHALWWNGMAPDDIDDVIRGTIHNRDEAAHRKIEKQLKQLRKQSDSGYLGRISCRVMNISTGRTETTERMAWEEL